MMLPLTATETAAISDIPQQPSGVTSPPSYLSTLLQWLRAGHVELLYTCAQRVYANRDMIFSAMQTVIRVHKLLSQSSSEEIEGTTLNQGETTRRNVSTVNQEEITRSITTINEYVRMCESSVIDFIISLLNQVSCVHREEYDS